MGDENDYLICCTTRRPTLEEGEFPVKQYYFSTVSSPMLRQMPQLNKEYEQLAEKCTGRFKGDPSLPLDDEPEEGEDEGEDAVEKERFREMHRLAYVVAQIEHDAAIVPRSVPQQNQSLGGGSSSTQFRSSTNFQGCLYC
jgi:hypothetical protein